MNHIKMTAPPPENNMAAWFESRAEMRSAFLHKHGLADAHLLPVGDDCAFRRYQRVVKTQGGSSLILMEAVPDHAGFATPGHKLSDFIRIGQVLRDAGLSTPQIYAADTEHGYLLLEDFGDVSFKHALMDGQAHGLARDDAYALATDVLIHLRQSVKSETLSLPRYYDSHVHTGRRRVIDWYVPAIRAARNADGLVESYLAVWDRIEQGVPPCPEGFLHIDFHFENLMWRPQATGLAQCGILDFQGAMTGPIAYDLANLLEDARVDVPLAIRQHMLDRYISGMDHEQRDVFLRWYRILATQFHCRVIGQFIRLAVRDGKPRYLAHIPRLQSYIRDALQDPVLLPLREFFAALDVSFTEAVDLTPPKIAAFIRSDAF